MIKMVDFGFKPNLGEEKIPMTCEWKPFEGWKFLVDQHGAVHHLPDHETLNKMCEVYYKNGVIK